MTRPVRDLDILISTMQPELHEGVYCYATLAEGAALPSEKIIASIREREGLSVIVEEETAQIYGLQTVFCAAWITLTVHSDLAAVGLTAAFSAALGQAGISCNVVAGVYHDHLFVPHEQAQQALAALYKLQQTVAEAV
ncbi:ACT domain-containing protein [Neisseria chenwenguii]|uniref:Acetyltransferase n=1 Tax=Neisseria chenwenguii TaxID=1853278 RepID=A0A220S197_9NEIS|nr:ACT domain-containing protein [Neisseria chenwenguii]ASK27249.1 acetyltransferase [Neisseria chenwenguii]ROV54806.1 ACT domain-containing protein [Neisseria chenwenguii]